MPLLINREYVVEPGHLNSSAGQQGSLSRIASGMKVANNQSDSIGLDRFMRNMSALFSQDQIHTFRVESSAHDTNSQQPQPVW